MKSGLFSIKKNRSSRNLSDGIQNHLVGRINLTVAVHLVTEDVGDDEETWLDVVTDTR